MQASDFAFICALLVTMVHSELHCCIQVFNNGTASYTLNDTVPNNWIRSWTKDGVVFVSEDGDLDLSFVINQTKYGYILRQYYTGVLCKLESWEDGVSEEIPCKDLCNAATGIPPEDTGTGTGLGPSCITALICISLILLVCAFGFMVYKCWQKRRSNCSSDVEAGTEFMALNQQMDQNHNQEQDQSTNPNQKLNQSQDLDQNQAHGG